MQPTWSDLLVAGMPVLEAFVELALMQLPIKAKPNQISCKMLSEGLRKFLATICINFVKFFAAASGSKLHEDLT